MIAAGQVALLLGLVAQAPGAWIEVDARVEIPGDAGAAAAVGAPFHLVIEATHTPGTIALLPESLGLPAALGERTARRSHERTPGEREDRDVYRLELLAFEAGEHQIPAIPLAMGATTAHSPALSVLVESTLSPDEQLVAASTRAEALPALEQMAAASPGAVPVMVPDYTPAWALLGAILLIGGAVLLLRLSGRRRAAGDAGPPPPPPRPADEVAVEALAALRAQDPIAAGAFKVHYTELSTILRRYVGGRYGFESLELTHDELFDELRRRRPAGLDLDALAATLFTADQVKFAKFVPRPEEGYQALDEADRIVEATRPRPEPTSEGAEA